MHPIRAFFHEYEWIHLGLGLLGNLAFVVGSVFFLYEDLQPAGVWLFIIGSSGMFIGTLGNWVVKLKGRQGRRGANA